MALNQPSIYYDANRDMYYTAQEQHEREMHYRRQAEEHRKAQQYAYYNAAQQQSVLGQALLANAVPKPDSKDPLAFLTKPDNKILLTGEAT